MNQKIIKFKFKDKNFPSPAQYASMPFGRQIEFNKQIQQFKAEAKANYVSQKHTTSAQALNNFIKLYNVKEYFCCFYDGNECRDDSYVIWYKN